ncbi:ABC transporter ATP-binding protein [Actinoplanes sp. NPDC049265]|uniref:ABC transporter ATP-binding protein n=1 Tax=Actinoplanes sp. NPDC049265 TaxID=3363902 RepID=UPI0037185BAE
MTTTAPVLEVQDVGVRYGNVHALSPLSFSVGPAELVLVLGTNGAGKTSLVNAIAGLVPVAGGEVRVEGVRVTKVPAYRRVRRGVSLVPEGRGPLPGVSVADNLILGWRARRRGDYRQHLARAIDLFPILGKRLDQDCSTLSGGEMQMLAIARALLSDPSVLLLDEPSLGLAPQPVGQVYEALGRLAADGLSMIVVEQKAVPLPVTPALTLVLHHGEELERRENGRPSDAELADLYLGGGDGHAR